MIKASLFKQYLKRQQPCVNNKSSDNYFYGGEYSDTVSNLTMINLRITLINLFSLNLKLQGCLKSCYQKQVMNQCGCGDPNYPLPKVIPQLYETCSLIKSSNKEIIRLPMVC